MTIRGRSWIVQRWRVIIRRGSDGQLHRVTATWTDPFDDLVSAAAHYRRSLDGLWAESSWEDWGVTADAEVIAEAKVQAEAVPMPERTRVAMDALRSRLGSVQ